MRYLKGGVSILCIVCPFLLGSCGDDSHKELQSTHIQLNRSVDECLIIENRFKAFIESDVRPSIDRAKVSGTLNALDGRSLLERFSQFQTEFSNENCSDPRLLREGNVGRLVTGYFFKYYVAISPMIDLSRAMEHKDKNAEISVDLPRIEIALKLISDAISK